MRTTATAPAAPTADAASRVGAAAGPIERIRARLHAADEAKLRSRLRLQLQPWYAAAAVVSAGLIQELALLLGAEVRLCAAANALAISATLGALAAFGRGCWSQIRDWLRAHPLRGAAAGAGAWAWLLYAAVAEWSQGLDVARAGVLLLVVLAAHWWQRHRPGHAITQLVEAAPEPEVAEPWGVAAEVAAAWSNKVAARRGAYTGSYLSDYNRLQFGHEWTINFDGLHGTGIDSVDLKEVAYGLNKEPNTLIMEPHPESPQRGLLRWIEASPVIGKVRPEAEFPFAIEGRPLWQWTPPGEGERYPEGRSTIGLYADGIGTHEWLTYRSGRMFGGFIYGGTGAGKGILLAQLMLSWRTSGATAFWCVDGSEAGDSYKGNIVDYADWDRTHGPDQARQALEAAYALMCDRGLGSRKGEFVPTELDPGLVLILDESHNLLTTDEDRDFPVGDIRRWSNLKLAEEISRRGGKCGVALVLATQDATLKAFGGSAVLRNSVMQGNCMIMRGEKGAGNVLGSKVNAASLQAGGGYAYALATTDETGKEISRSAVLRGAFIHHDDYESHFDQVQGARLGPVAVRIVDAYTGGAYTAAAEVTTADIKRQEDERRAAFERGELTLAEYLPHLFGSGAAAAAPAVRGEGAVDREHLPAGVPAIEEFLRQVPAAAAMETVPAAAPPSSPVLSGAQAAVWEVVAASDTAATAGVEAALEGSYSRSSILQALKDLTGSGHLTKIGHGRYQARTAA